MENKYNLYEFKALSHNLLKYISVKTDTFQLLKCCKQICHARMQATYHVGYRAQQSIIVYTI